MNILLIMPCPDGPNWFRDTLGRLALPLATTHLAGLTPRRHRVSAVDMLAGERVDYDADVDLVGITVRTSSADAAYAIADAFLKRGKKVVLGGAHVTVHPQEGKLHASAVVVGEAENVWEPLLNDCESGRLKPFYVGGPFDTRQLGGDVFHVPERPSLVSLPHSNRDVLRRALYRHDSLFTSRGCPYSCSFCSNDYLNGRAVRHRPIDEVLAELQTLRRRFHLCDDSAFGTPAEQDYYHELYTRMARLAGGYRWYGEGSLNVTVSEKGRRLVGCAAKSGLELVQVGIESLTAGAHKQSGAWRKHGVKGEQAYDIRETEEAVRVFQRNKIQVIGFFIVGFDADTPDSFDHIDDFCRRTGIIPFISLLQTFPGSKTYREYTETGRLDQKIPWSDYGHRGRMIFKHPTGREREFERKIVESLQNNYTRGKIWKRSLSSFYSAPSIDRLISLLVMQHRIRAAIPNTYAG